MSLRERLRRIVGRWFRRNLPTDGEAEAALGGWWGPEPHGNDAVAYGVSVLDADVAPGDRYWRAVRVHHLEPEENGGRHHVFIDLLDEAGERVFDAQARVTCDGQAHLVTVEKPLGEPGANLATWGGQVCLAEALGLTGAHLPSDRVVGMHADHPDEPPGNTRFHHSFLVVFQQSTREGVVRRSASLVGTLLNGAGHEVLLLADDEPVAVQTVGDDQRFRFAGLWAASYVVEVAGTGIRSDPVILDGLEAVTVVMELDPALPSEEKPLEEYVLFGPPDTPGTQTALLLALDYLLAAQPVFGFRFEEAVRAERVLIVGGTEAVSIVDQRELAAAGCQVERISGDSRAMQQRLTELVAERGT
jgi:hypothetical protein